MFRTPHEARHHARPEQANQSKDKHKKIHQHQHVGISVNTDTPHTTNKKVFPNKVQEHPCMHFQRMIGFIASA